MEEILKVLMMMMMYCDGWQWWLMDVDILDPLNMQSCNFPVPGDTDTNKKKVVICGQVPEP